MTDDTDDTTTAKPIADSEPVASTTIDSFLLSGYKQALIDFSTWAAKEPTWDAYAFSLSLSTRERHAASLESIWEFNNPFPVDPARSYEDSVKLAQARSAAVLDFVQGSLKYLDEHQPGWDRDPNWGLLHK